MSPVHSERVLSVGSMDDLDGFQVAEPTIPFVRLPMSDDETQLRRAMSVTGALEGA